MIKKANNEKHKDFSLMIMILNYIHNDLNANLIIGYGKAAELKVVLGHAVSIFFYIKSNICALFSPNPLV